MTQPRILVTGATGQLGLLILDAMLKVTPASDIAGIVRPAKDGAPSRAERLESRGVQARAGDYADPASLRAALQGIERLLFISSSSGNSRDLARPARRPRSSLRLVLRAGAEAGVRVVLHGGGLRTRPCTPPMPSGG